MNEGDKIQLSVTLENGQFKIAARDVEQALGKMGAGVSSASKQVVAGNQKMGSSFGGLMTLAKGFIGLQIVQTLFSIGKAALQGAANLEKNKIAFETMLGSGKKAATLMDDIQTMAAKTPLETESIVNSAKQLIAFGESADTVIGTMTRLGDAAMGDAATFDRLTLAYGKTQAKQKATMEELNMFTEAGVPILQALANQMSGGNTAAIMKMVEAGKVGFKDVQQALNNLTTGSGQFAGMMEKQSRTLGGVYSTFKDSLSMLATEFGGLFSGVMKTLLKGASIVIDTLTKGIRSIKKRQEEFNDSGIELYRKLAMSGTKDKEGKYTYVSKANERTGYKGGEKYTYQIKDGMEYATHTSQSGYTTELEREYKREEKNAKKPVIPSFSPGPGPKPKEETLADKFSKYMGYAQKVVDFSNTIVNSIQNIFAMQDQIEQQALENKKARWDAAVDYWLQVQMRMQGLEEEVASKRSARELQQLNVQYSRTGNLIKRKNLASEIEIKRHEHQKQKLEEEAAEKKRKIELVYDFLKHQLAVKEFRRNQQMQYANATIQMVTGTLAAFAQGVAMFGPIVGAIVGGAMATVVQGLGAWTLATIAQQQPPMMAAGGFVLGSQSGKAIIAGDRGGTEAIVPLDNDEQMEKFREKTGGGGVTINNHYHGAVLDGPKAGRWLRDTINANGWQIKTRGAY